jgi:hypothetical protein
MSDASVRPNTRRGKSAGQRAVSGLAAPRIDAARPFTDPIRAPDPSRANAALRSPMRAQTRTDLAFAEACGAFLCAARRIGLALFDVSVAVAGFLILGAIVGTILQSALGSATERVAEAAHRAEQCLQTSVRLNAIEYELQKLECQARERARVAKARGEARTGY